MPRTSSESHRLSWGMGALGLAALTGAFFVHERREQARFDGVTHRLEELRLLATRDRDTPSEVRVDTRILGGDSLADDIATRVLARSGACSAAPAAVGAQAPDEPKGPPSRTADQQRLVTRASDIVDQALRARELRRSDVVELRSIFASLPPMAERDDMRARLVKGINDQQLAVEDPAFIMF